MANPGSRISNISDKRFKELFNIFEREKNKKTFEIRTDNQEIGDVVKNILKLIKK